MQVSRENLLVNPGMGESVAMGGIGIILKVLGLLSGGMSTIVEHPIEPGRLARKQKGSKSREKQRQRMEKIHVRITARRRNHRHQLST